MDPQPARTSKLPSSLVSPVKPLYLTRQLIDLHGQDRKATQSWRDKRGMSFLWCCRDGHLLLLWICPICPLHCPECMMKVLLWSTRSIHIPGQGSHTGFGIQHFRLQFMVQNNLCLGVYAMIGKIHLRSRSMLNAIYNCKLPFKNWYTLNKTKASLLVEYEIGLGQCRQSWDLKNN